MQQEPFAGWESLNVSSVAGLPVGDLGELYSYLYLLLFFQSMSSRSRRSRSSSRGSPRRRSHHSRKAVEKECSICDNPAMHNKKVCLMCWESMSGKRADDQWSAMRDWFKESMSKSLEDLVGTVTANVIQKVGPSAPVMGKESRDPKVPAECEARQQGAARCSLSATSEEEEELIVLDEDSSFDLDLIEPLVKAVRKVLELEDTEQEKKQDRMFKSSGKKDLVFPVHDVLKDIIKEEWAVPDKKYSEPRHMKKMYPYAEGDVSRWTNPPKVDAAITRVARKTTLPVDEGVSLKDPVERRQDTVLRKAYSVSGLLCKPAVAVTCVAKASKIWLQEIETELQLAGDKDKMGHLVGDIKVAIDFITDASLEVLKLAARNMGYAVAARRMLWLKHWQADTPSKFNLCALPFEGELLFGPKLDSIISKASAGKSSFLPQERRVRRQPVRAGWADRMPFKDAKTYRPGKQFDRQPFWRNRGQNQLKKEFKQGKPKSF
ncbi:uncharacterized protein LOC121401378 isoform X1 [Xenopus laevis]|uniref:Uncharacterized protein LOC121396587 n=1 Tax=Xenopus laevis TaxID=8355 RepID=A0A8J1LF15_XENLA|nr:uncharacterized protein LOC121396587 [Xenopus laevis]XP_041441870.1 uncharacterized protein LOC121401378 isoform X1 [Xenopus laevis]